MQEIVVKIVCLRMITLPAPYHIPSIHIIPLPADMSYIASTPPKSL